MATTRSTRIIIRRDSIEAWLRDDPVLAAGEIGYEDGNPGRMKVGNGISPWTMLDYLAWQGPGGDRGPAGFNGEIGPAGATGTTGAAGPQGTVAVGTVSTGDAGTSAIVTNAGSSSAAVFNFTIPRGAEGTGGTASVGTVTTGAAGTQASVSNTGTSANAVLNFVLPVGNIGATGPTGPTGATGAQGIQGIQGATGSAASTDIVTEGSTNKYFTNQRATDATQAALNNATLPSTGLMITKTGDWARFQPQIFFLSPAHAFQIDQQSGTSVYTKYTGKFLGASYFYSEMNVPAGQTRILTIRFDDLVGTSNNVSISLYSMALTTTVEFPALKICLGGFSVTSMLLLTSLSAPELEYIGQNLSLGPYAAYVGTISFPKLKYVNGSLFYSSMGPVAAYSFPMLIGVNSQISFSSSTTTTAINLSSLVWANGGIQVSAFTALTSFNLPALKFMGNGFTFSGSTLLNTFSAPALHTCNGSLSFSANPALANFTLPIDGSLKVVMGAFSCTYAVLTSASVNNIMQALGSLDGSNGTTTYSSTYTIDISGGGNAVPTPVSIATDYAGSAFTSSSNTCTVSRVGHGFITGDVLQVSGVLTLTNANRYARITRVSDDVFTYTIVSQSNLAGTGTGIKVRKHNAYVNAIVTRGQTLTTNS